MPIPEDDLHLYDIVSARRIHHDALVWQVPALGLAAQAFLFTVALAPDTGRGPRIVSALLSAVAALVSVLLMMSHRAYELADALWIDAFEAKYAVQAQRDVGPTATGPRGLRWMIRLHAFDAWAWGLALFAVAVLGVAVLTIVRPQFFGRA